MFRGGWAACAAAQLLVVACGEEVPRTPAAQADSAFTGQACDLVSSSELSQIFVSELEPEHTGSGGDAGCTWTEAESGSPVFSYRVHPYIQDLPGGVRQVAGEGDMAVEIKPGLGESAVWTDAGLFVSRSGRTLQVTPFDEELPRELYEELAILLLERLETP